MSKKIKIEVVNEEDQKILKVLQNGSYTYKEIAHKVFGTGDIYTVKHVYQAVSRIRKSGLPFYPFKGPGTEVIIPKDKRDGELVLDYVTKRSLGVLRGAMRTVKYVDEHFKLQSKVSEKIELFENVLKY